MIALCFRIGIQYSSRSVAIRRCHVAISQVGQQIQDSEMKADVLLHEEGERRDLLNDIARDVDEGAGGACAHGTRTFCLAPSALGFPGKGGARWAGGRGGIR